MNEKQLEVSIESVKGLLIDGYNNYEKSLQRRQGDSRYWDGYIRGIQHVLEMHDQWKLNSVVSLAYSLRC